LGIITLGFEVTDRQLGTLFLHSSDTGKEQEYNETVHQLVIDFGKVCGSDGRKVLRNIFIEFGIPMKLVRSIETYVKVTIGTNLSDMFHIQNGLKQGEA
jgi:hypothetical protein